MFGKRGDALRGLKQVPIIGGVVIVQVRNTVPRIVGQSS